MPSPICPHGDEACPCPDGLACHYEGFTPFPCPNRPWPVHQEQVTLADGSSFPVTFDMHCHLEGCSWENEGCGLARVLPRATLALMEQLPVVIGSPYWACGSRRAAAIIWDDLEAQ